MRNRLLVGSRGSQLARKQAEAVISLLQDQGMDYEIESVIIQTTGDTNQAASLSEIGGKSVFVKELEVALTDHHIDLAVHSLKDVTSAWMPGLAITGFLTPESICDTLICRYPLTVETLPPQAKIGTGSMRRKALLSTARSDLCYHDIRGNVETRLRKLLQAPLDAVVLSEAGMIRLGFLPNSFPGLRSFEFEGQQYWTYRLEKEWFFPAPGQGVVAIEHRVDDEDLMGYIKKISDPHQTRISQLELGLLSVLGFDCRIPFGSYVELQGDQFAVHVFHPNGQESIRVGNDLDALNTIQKWAQLLKERLV